MPSILIAEDSPTQAENLKFLLEEHGHSVVIAGDGRQALTEARRCKPALIISDILMPHMDGYQLCREVKADDGLKDIPVVLITALNSSLDIIKGLECGADSFLRKPFEAEQLSFRLEQALYGGDPQDRRKAPQGIELLLGGRRVFVNARRQQILDLLMATYEESARIGEELIEANRQLKLHSEELERAARIKDDFLSTMSHEMRTPLQAILGHAEMALGGHCGTLTEDLHESFDAVQGGGRYLLRLTNDILDLSRIEAGRLELVLEEIVINGLIAQIATSLRPLSEGKGQTLLQRPAQDLRVQADSTRIRQVLTNLVGNAIKFTPAGGRIELWAALDGGMVRVNVLDTGPGIPVLERPHIFDPFYRIKRNQERTEGTGLGLAIAKKLVELHGGTLDIESRSLGSCFSFTIPQPADGRQGLQVKLDASSIDAAMLPLPL